MKMSPQLFSLIKKDHRKVEEIFSEIEDTTDRAVKTRQELYARLRSELVAHTSAEEKAVYPWLKNNEITEEIGFEAAEEHDIVKYLLGKMDHTSCDSPEWCAQVTALQEAVEHHVEEEEKKLFPKMRRAFSKGELDQMAMDFQRSKDVATEEPEATERAA